MKSKKSSSLAKISRKYHKWLMLFIGVQFVIWSVTGTYMVFLNINYIHGNSLVVNHQAAIDADSIEYSQSELLLQHPNANNIKLGTFIDTAVYSFSVDDKQHVIDANNGRLLSPIDKATAISAAKHYYSGSPYIDDITLIEDNPPFELRASALPAWRVDFEGVSAPTIYVSAETGQLVGKRHQFWRIFDWMFRFHVMDYDDGSDIDNSWLFILAILGMIGTISGIFLTYYHVFKSSKPVSF